MCPEHDASATCVAVAIATGSASAAATEQSLECGAAKHLRACCLVRPSDSDCAAADRCQTRSLVTLCGKCLWPSASVLAVPVITGMAQPETAWEAGSPVSGSCGWQHHSVFAGNAAAFFPCTSCTCTCTGYPCPLY